MITTGLNIMASMMGCSSVMIGNCILDSWTSRGRITDTAFMLLEDSEKGSCVFVILSAKAVEGSFRSSPRGPRIEFGRDINLRFLDGGAAGCSVSRDDEVPSVVSWPFAMFSCFTAQSLNPRCFLAGKGRSSSSEDELPA